MKKYIIKLILIILLGKTCLASTVTFDTTSQTNPTGTYTSSVQILEGWTRMKGLVVLDSTGTPTSRINQATDATSVLASTWYGTDTIHFVKEGNTWVGRIDFGIYGRYGQLTIGNRAGATFNRIFWYGSEETSIQALTSSVLTTNSVIVVSPTSTILLNANPYRKYFLLVNTGTATDCAFALNSSISAFGSGTPLVKGTSNNNGYGSYESNSSNNIYTGAVSAITSAGTTSVSVIEY